MGLQIGAIGISYIRPLFAEPVTYYFNHDGAILPLSLEIIVIFVYKRTCCKLKTMILI